MNLEILKQIDKKNLWHPFTQHGLDMDFPIVKKAQGAWLILDDGKKLLDAVSSWWVTIHGHCQTDIGNTIADQARNLDHVLFANFTHEPAILLAEKLLQQSNGINPKKNNLSRCFYSDNGSTAVEVAIKMAFQYFKNLDIHHRKKFIAFEGSYHGDTLGAMSVSQRGSYHNAFEELMPAVDFVKLGDIHILKELLLQNPCHYAAVIVEPLIQGAAGMKIYPAEILAEIAALCQATNTLLIVDEVFTAFYRTGTFFAYQQAGISPDLVCIAKGITGGFLPLAATLTTEAVFNVFKSTETKHTFLHGHSYTANPITCAAALTSFNLLQKMETQIAIKNLIEKTRLWIERLKKNSKILNARCLGTIGAVTINHQANYLTQTSQNISKIAAQNGVLLRPLGNVIYAVPPYCVTNSEIDLIYSTIELITNLIGNS